MKALLRLNGLTTAENYSLKTLDLHQISNGLLRFFPATNRFRHCCLATIDLTVFIELCETVMEKVLCLGPTGSGKTLLIKRLRGKETVDETSCTVPTNGTNLTVLKFPHPKTGVIKEYVVREVGGNMAPMWSRYYEQAKKLIYVVDASNLCQISAAGVLLYTILTEPELQKTKILIALTKMDVSYRQMRNEALLMLQMKRLQTEVNQSITLLEASAVTGEGVDNIVKWLQDVLPNNASLRPK